VVEMFQVGLIYGAVHGDGTLTVGPGCL